jgi:hypothetical protein
MAGLPTEDKCDSRMVCRGLRMKDPMDRLTCGLPVSSLFGTKEEA